MWDNPAPMIDLSSPPRTTPHPPALDVAQLGQVFTPDAVVQAMLALRRNAGRTLEPSCGNGAFLRHLPGAVAIELDPRHAPRNALIGMQRTWWRPKPAANAR